MTASARSRITGVTMIELLIALVVISILVALAYPSYRDKVFSGRRAEGKTALSDLANRMESYYAKTNTYATATIATGASTDVLPVATTSQGYYALSIDAAGTSATTYRILATPIGVQAGDTKCARLGLTAANVKSVSGTGTVAACW